MVADAGGEVRPYQVKAQVAQAGNRLHVVVHDKVPQQRLEDTAARCVLGPEYGRDHAANLQLRRHVQHFGIHGELQERPRARHILAADTACYSSVVAAQLRRGAANKPIPLALVTRKERKKSKSKKKEKEEAKNKSRAYQRAIEQHQGQRVADDDAVALSF